MPALEALQTPEFPFFSGPSATGSARGPRRERQGDQRGPLRARPRATGRRDTTAERAAVVTGRPGLGDRAPWSFQQGPRVKRPGCREWRRRHGCRVAAASFPPTFAAFTGRSRPLDRNQQNPSHMGRGLYRMVPNPALCWSEAATRSIGKFFAGAEDQAGNADLATQPTATDLGANPVCLGPRDVPTWMAPAEHLDRVAPANPGRRARGRSHCGAGRRLEGALTSLRRRCRSPGRGRSGSRGLCDWGGCRLDGPPLPASRASARRAAR